MTRSAADLCAAGPIASIARVGHAPLGEDDPIEIAFANGSLYHIDIGFKSASDIRIGEGALIEYAFGHLRAHEPSVWAAIARDWSRQDMDLQWAIGKTLANPRRVAITEPFRFDAGVAYDVGARTLVVLGEADFIYAAALDDEQMQSFALDLRAWSAREQV